MEEYVYFISPINHSVYYGKILEDIKELDEYKIKLIKIVISPHGKLNDKKYEDDEEILLYVPKQDVFKTYKSAKNAIMHDLIRTLEFYVLKGCEEESK